LDKDSIESSFRQQLKKIFAWPAEAIKATGDIRESRWLEGGLLIEPAAPKSITASRNKIIERGQLARAELPADAEETIRAQPEVEGSEVIDRRINKKQVHRTS